jgi:hypothetical protein
MEKAVYITKIDDINEVMNRISDFSRVYFGNEFCERLLPKREELEEMLVFAKENGMRFTFVTPYVTNQGLRILEKLFEYLSKTDESCEVVFNDFGVLKVLLKRYEDDFKPVMGRLLIKMKRGPRLMNLIDILPETSVRYFRSYSLDTRIFRDFLLKNKIERVELDNLLQGVHLNLANHGISASLYVPYAYITTTRACLSINCDVLGKEDDVGVFPCKKECQKYVFYLRNRIMPVLLIRKGNTVFFKNEKIPENLEKIGVDRIVYETKIPL